MRNSLIPAGQKKGGGGSGNQLILLKTKQLALRRSGSPKMCSFQSRCFEK